MSTTYVRLPVLFVAWREPGSRIFRVVGRLVAIPAEQANRFQFEFSYTAGARIASKAGFQGLRGIGVGNDFDRVVRDKKLPLFFTEEQGSGDALEVLDQFATGVIHPKDDSYEVFSAPYEQGPNAEGDSCYLLNFFIHGLRYLDVDQAKRSSELSKGDSLVVSHEPVPEDPDALAIRTNDKGRVGYLPRYLAPDTRLIENDPCALQIRVLENRGELCPPNRRVQCQLRACWPSGFRPFDLPTFQPIGDATRLFGHNAVLS